MNLLPWVITGMIVGVLSTAWQEKLSVKSLILSVIIGSIGSFSGGVIGYLFYGANIDNFDVTIFITALSVTVMTIILKRKVKSFHLQRKTPRAITVTQPAMKLTIV